MTIAICKNRFTDFHSPTKNNTMERVERFPSNGSQLPVGFVSVKTESFMYFTWTLSRTLCSPSNTWRCIDRPCALCQCRIIEIKVRAFAKCHHLILQINLQRQDNGGGNSLPRLSFPPCRRPRNSRTLHQPLFFFFSISIEIAIRLLTVGRLTRRGNAHNGREWKRGGQI